MKARGRGKGRLSRKVETFLRTAKAENTVRAYAADMRHFVAWGGRVPASPNTIAEYLADLSSTHRYSSIARRKAAISAAHRERGYENPCSSNVVRSVLKGVRRRILKPPRQMRPLLWPQVLQLAEGNGKNLTGLRARAVLLLGFAGAFRRAELTALTVEDVGWRRNDLVVRLPRSKGDQEGAGQEVTIANARSGPVGKALLGWLSAARIASGPIFRRIHGSVVAAEPMPASGVTALVKAQLGNVGIDPRDYGAHSLRAGFVTSAALEGVPLWRIKRHTRHSRDTMVETYVREEGAARPNAAINLWERRPATLSRR